MITNANSGRSLRKQLPDFGSHSRPPYLRHPRLPISLASIPVCVIVDACFALFNLLRTQVVTQSTTQACERAGGEVASQQSPRLAGRKADYILARDQIEFACDRFATCPQPKRAEILKGRRSNSTPRIGRWCSPRGTRSLRIRRGRWRRCVRLTGSRFMPTFAAKGWTLTKPRI